MSNHRQLQIPETINKHIRRAWIAAVISASVTLLLVFLSIGGVKILEGINALSILDVLILSGLALGVYKRSRVCAIILLAYGIFNEIYMVSEGHKPSPLRLIFMYYYFRGVLATFAYYRLNPSQKTFTMPPPPPEPTLLVRNSWFIYLGQQVKGPFSIDQLKALLSVGTICNDTKCCAEGTQDWQPISALFL